MRIPSRLLIAEIGLAAALSGCERPPVETLQGGYRGTAMATLINPRTDAVKAQDNTVPAPLPAASAEGPLAASVYQNVQVLKDLNVGQFTRVMLAMTQWVAPPEQSCNYCHVGNMAADDRYTKVVARRMLQMVRHINSDWKDHVAATGVTCYTCHRGHVVPAQVWFESPVRAKETGWTASAVASGAPLAAPGMTSLPYDPFTSYFAENPKNIRVIADAALPGADNASLQRTESTYSLMIHMGTALGVNCTYCHNTRSFAIWDSSTPKRTTAWYGIRMVRDLNVNYMIPLTSTFPTHRLGPLGDVAKTNCATCHQGVFKPLYGVSMAKDYPELQGPMHAEAAAALAALPSAKIFFASGKSADVAADSESLDPVIAYLKTHADAKAVLSGFNDPTGNKARNAELSKLRAFHVRAALEAAGIGESQIVLEKPQDTNGAGNLAEARRVDVTIRM